MKTELKNLGLALLIGWASAVTYSLYDQIRLQDSMEDYWWCVITTGGKEQFAYQCADYSLRNHVTGKLPARFTDIKPINLK